MEQSRRQFSRDKILKLPSNFVFKSKDISGYADILVIIHHI